VDSRDTFTIIVLAFCMMNLAPIAGAQAGFISFDFPGAIDTQATAISPSGDIAGRYTSADGALHGFIHNRAGFHSIDFPNAVRTEVNWINARGFMVGDYVDANGITHGFLLNQQNFTTIDYPGAPWTVAFGVGGSGDIVGIYGDNAGVVHGFLLEGGTFSSIDYPGAEGTFPTMISAGRVVGGYSVNGQSHGFLLYRGQFKTVDCPGAFTFFSGIDPQGRMVGGYGTFDGNYHGALAFNGNCSTVDIAGGTKTWANGSDPQGDIVGRYTGADGVVHGYLLRRFVKTANIVYAAAHDFSFTSNPNAMWSYGYSMTTPSAFAPDTVSGSTYISGEAGWFGPIPGWPFAPGYPLVVAQPNSIPGVLDMGPGQSSYAVVRWTATSRGRWDVVGQFSGTGSNTGDVHVLRNGKAVFDSPLNGSEVASFSLALYLVPGDTVDFAAGPGPGGDPSSDATGFDVTITPEL